MNDNGPDLSKPLLPDKRQLLSERDLLIRIDVQMEGMKTAIIDHEARLRIIEKFQWIAIGIAVTVSTIISVVVPILRGH